MAELVDTNSATAKASDILQGKTAYVKNGLVEGTIPVEARHLFAAIPKTESWTAFPRGVYNKYDAFIAGDANLVPENIAKGVTIFGVKGTWEGEPPPPGLPEGFYEISIQPNNPVAGETSKGGIAGQGMNIVVSADANGRDDFSFDAWLEGDESVSQENPYTFTVERDRDLIAKFLKHYYIFNTEWEDSSSSLAGPISPNWTGIVCGNGVWVAVPSTGAATTVYSYSLDGVAWNRNTIPLDCCDIAYGNGKFVAIVNNSSKYGYSSDGINWTVSYLPSSQYYSGISFANGKFFVLANSTSLGYYSEDGITWNGITMGFSASWRKVAYGNGRYVAVAWNTNSTQNAAYSDDGITWTRCNMPSSYANDIAYGNGRFVVVNSFATGGTNYIYYSDDGITWKSVANPVKNATIYGITYGLGRFVAPVYNSSKVIYSEDGITWAEADLPLSSSWAHIDYGAGKFVALADNKNNSAYSRTIEPDEGTYCVISLSSNDPERGAVYGGGAFLNGTSVAVKAVSSGASYEFVAWKENGLIVSHSAEYMFTATKDRNLMAEFEAIPIYTISATVDPEGSGVVHGTGDYMRDESVTITASAGTTHKFHEWVENGITLGNTNPLSFVAEKDRSLVAKFKEIETERIGNKNIGDIVKLNVGGVQTEFVVIQQGLPSSSYDSSCNGTWLQMKDCYAQMVFSNPANNDYENSQPNKYLNGQFFELLDANVRENVKEVKIPYVKNGVVYSASNGLSAKVFLLSATEIRFNGGSSYQYTEGKALSYFASANTTMDGSRIAYYNKVAVAWWTRSSLQGETEWTIAVNANGSANGVKTTTNYYVRPTIIVDSAMLIPKEE